MIHVKFLKITHPKFLNEMRSICHIKIQGQKCNLEFQVRKYDLYDESRYFHSIINENPGQTEFTFSKPAFDQKVYTLYFSEFPSENIPQYQINSSIDDNILQQLLKLNEIFQADRIKEKIFKIFEENGNIIHFIQKFFGKKVKAYVDEEKQLFNKLNEKSIESFIKSNLSQERKMRLLWKFLKQQKDQNNNQFIKQSIFSRENNQEIFMVLFSEEEIFQGKRKKLNTAYENIMLPNMNKFIHKEMKEKQEQSEKELKEKQEQSEKNMKEKLEKAEREIKELKEKQKQSENEMKEKLEQLEREIKEMKDKHEKEEQKRKEEEQ